MGGMMGMMALPLRVPNLDAPAALRVGARGVPGDCPPPSSGAASGRASSAPAAGQHASGSSAQRPRWGRGPASLPLAASIARARQWPRHRRHHGPSRRTVTQTPKSRPKSRPREPRGTKARPASPNPAFCQCEPPGRLMMRRRGSAHWQGRFRTRMGVDCSRRGLGARAVDTKLEHGAAQPEAAESSRHAHSPTAGQEWARGPLSAACLAGAA
jgi:hypothetical protein